MFKRSPILSDLYLDELAEEINVLYGFSLNRTEGSVMMNVNETNLKLNEKMSGDNK